MCVGILTQNKMCQCSVTVEEYCLVGCDSQVWSGVSLLMFQASRALFLLLAWFTLWHWRWGQYWNVQTTRHHIPEDNILNHHENLRSQMSVTVVCGKTSAKYDGMWFHGNWHTNAYVHILPARRWHTVYGILFRLSQGVTYLICIQEVMGSNLIWTITYPHWRLLWYSVALGEWWTCTGLKVCFLNIWQQQFMTYTFNGICFSGKYVCQPGRGVFRKTHGSFKKVDLTLSMSMRFLLVRWFHIISIPYVRIKGKGYRHLNFNRANRDSWIVEGVVCRHIRLPTFNLRYTIPSLFLNTLSPHTQASSGTYQTPFRTVVQSVCECISRLEACRQNLKEVITTMRGNMYSQLSTD
jgi:hypothetical protein